MEAILLEVKDVTKRFGGVMAVDDVSMVIKEGEINGLIGPNGAGKTTLLNLISGIYRPTRGRIYFCGHDITGESASARAGLSIGRTFQQPQLFGEMTALENVALGQYTRTRIGFLGGGLWPGASFHKNLQALRQSSMERMELVGLQDISDVQCGGLPYGQKKILEIARAMGCMPRLLLLDEPAAGLNHSEVEQMNKLILKIHSKGISVLLIEHNMRMVMNLCHKLTVLDFGRVIALGTPDEIRSNERVQEAYLGKSTRRDGRGRRGDVNL